METPESLTMRDSTVQDRRTRIPDIHMFPKIVRTLRPPFACNNTSQRHLQYCQILRRCFLVPHHISKSRNHHVVSTTLHRSCSDCEYSQKLTVILTFINLLESAFDDESVLA